MIVIILLTALFAGAYIYWTYVQYKTGWHLLKKVPGPFTFWVFGNVPQIGLTAEDNMTQVRRWAHQYNYGLARMYGGAQPYLMVINPKAMEQVLSSTTLIYKYDPYKFFYPWLGQGLLTSNGRHWLNHRKMITPSFHFAILQDFLKIMNDTTDRFMVLLGDFAAKEDMFDFQEIVTRSTIDVICEAAMGTPVNAIVGRTSPMVPAIAELCDVMRQRIFSALNRLDFFFVWTEAYRKQERALTVLRKELSEIIEKRRVILKEIGENKFKSDADGKRPKMAFLDNLLTAEVEGKPLTFQDIFEEVSTFVFEGHDTTASAIGFTIYSLSRHTQIQERAFQEQYAIFGNDLQRNPTYQELGEMKYLELILKETLRLYPSVPFIVRTLQEQTEIGGFQIPAGTSIGCIIIALGTNPHSFPEPFKFKPERFENRITSNPYDYVPFSAGPRNCIGQKFAMMELKVTVSKIIRHFNILPAVDGLSTGIHDPADPNDKFDNPYDARLGFYLTLKSVNGLKIRLRRRVY
ncbi:probable cytochrome P450 4e1 isoform X1 [Rhagoletis pomonella]|uniref:probable cytochrome P450 4e1 isoform X1 n=2 Tax=Rhagoletis pomonella TaxID=28610 RepID=UPI0017824FC7|nr:probable cytochrome P450 4e1 isoform X1 [Rhagoletis pomonella]